MGFTRRINLTNIRAVLAAAPWGDWLAAAFFVIVAASTVAIPTVAYAIAGARLDDTMRRLKDWMEKNNAALMAVVMVVIGAMVLHNGARALGWL